MSKSASASPETTAARWKITSGRLAIRAATAAASAMSSFAATVATGEPAGGVGSITSTSVIRVSPGGGSFASDAATFAPSMPAAPVIRMCIRTVLPLILPLR